MKSVVGLEWMKGLVSEWKENKRWYRVFPDNEVFQFGNGEHLTSRYCVHFEAMLATRHVVLAMSVVNGNCPPLLSRHACSQLGLHIDCGQHTLSSRKLNVKGYGMKQARNGHYIIPISRFEEGEMSEVQSDFRVPLGLEAFIVPFVSNQMPKRLYSESDRPSLTSTSEPDHGNSHSWEADFGEGQGEESVGSIVGGTTDMQAVRREGSSSSRVPHVVGARRPRREGDGGRLRGSREGEEGVACSASSASELVPGLSGEERVSRLHTGLGPGFAAGTVRGRDEDDQQEAREDSSGQNQEGDSGSVDRAGCGLPKLESCMVSGSESQPGLCRSFEDEDVSMEEVSLAVEGEASGGASARIEMEEEPPLAGNVDGQGGGRALGTLRINETEDARSGSMETDVSSQALLRRGEVQRLKRGVRQGLAAAEALVQVASKEERFVVMEVFAGTATLSGLAHSQEFTHWCATPPVDILYGYDLRTSEDQQKVMKMWEETEPDLLTLSMPCGPWCQWMNLCDPELVAEKRTEEMPLWRFARMLWDRQVAAGRLVMSENPLGSDGLKLTFMEERPQLNRAKIAQCMFGLKDVESGKPHRKLTALDVNTPAFQERLLRGAQCQHAPSEHQTIEGKVFYQGQWVNRSTLAGAWPKKLCRHILKAAEACLREVRPVEMLALCEETDPHGSWEIGAVGSSQVPEESLRHAMGELGGAADRYGYITFEGQGQQVPRRIRSAVAHLHSALGHLANDRLVRMLMLSGAGEQILTAARNLRCQVCAMVQPPRDAPQVSYKKPSTFNEKVSGDTFFIWDVLGAKFAVVHFLDELTDYHVGDCAVNMDSTFAAGVLRDQWYGVFGPPDLLITDMGKEFAGTIDTLNEIMGVRHDVIAEGAKWRLGHAERHGSILKIMLMKMVKAMNLRGLDDMRMAATAACAAKNRLCNHGGVSPLQAVTGRNALLPASLMTQICSGRMKFVVNQELSREESLQRSERIRTGALESFHWLDAHQTLRRALSTKSRPPRLEMIKEGATVYIYDPPAKRRGLSRRIQDNVSWEGPGTVVCVEKEKAVPSKIWVRLKGRVKAVPLEKVRLATVEELVSGHFIKEALDEVQKELTSGRMRVEEIPAGDVADEDREEVAEQNVLEDGTESDTSVGTLADQPEGENELDEDKETERMRFEKRLLTDVPLSFVPPPETGGAASSASMEDPYKMPFAKKQRLFENLAKELGAPSPMQEARLRGQLEDAFARLKTVRKSLKAVRPKAKAEPRGVQRRRAVNAVSHQALDVMVALEIRRREGEGEEYAEAEERRGADADGPEESEGQSNQPLFNVFSRKEIPRKARTIDAKGDNDLIKVIREMEKNEAEYGHEVTEVLWQDRLWTRPSIEATEALVLQRAEDRGREDQKVLDASQLLTGKDRVELNWRQLEEKWKKAFVPAILKAFKVYFDHEAIQGVPMGQWVEPQRILPSRLVLTNKGEKELEGAILKARWVFGGHRDPDAGKYMTSSPTVSLVGHNLLNAIAVQMQWKVCYEDVSAAFLQGQRLPEEREIYVKVPTGYPDEALQGLREMIGTTSRQDVVRLVKGGFGLPESPRLWYLEYKQTLQSLGGRELRLLPGFFCFHDEKGELEGMACIHVDDTRYAGRPSAQRIWDELHRRLDFGKKREAVEGWTKFCGRHERQDPTTFEMYYSMEEYCKEIPFVMEREKTDMERPLTESEKKSISSVVGQLAWAARQCRYDLSYGCSTIQQMAGDGAPQTMGLVNRVVKKAHEVKEMKVGNLGCALSEVVFLSISDANYAGQPTGGSQGGVLVALANPAIQEGEAPLIFLEGHSSKLHRVVRCSMAAELSVAATAFEHGDYVRTVFAEMVKASFSLSRWKLEACCWRHILVLDAKVAYDALRSETAPTDRKLIVDIAVLREALEDPTGHSFVRWVPGREIPCDALTKWHANPSLDKIIACGRWSLMDTPLAAELRQRAAARKRASKVTAQS